MRSNVLHPLLCVAVLAGLSACEADEGAELEPMYGTSEVAPAPEIAEPPADAAVALDVTESQEYGAYLTDSSGRALYLLGQDPEGNSTCYDACAVAWPPLLAPDGAAMAGDPAIQEDLIGTLERTDGTTQVTYNGHPIYYHSQDQRPGQVSGQDLTDEWGEWYLVTPAGEELHAEAGGGSGGA